MSNKQTIQSAIQQIRMTHGSDIFTNRQAFINAVEDLVPYLEEDALFLQKTYDDDIGRIIYNYHASHNNQIYMDELRGYLSDKLGLKDDKILQFLDYFSADTMQPKYSANPKINNRKTEKYNTQNYVQKEKNAPVNGLIPIQQNQNATTVKLPLNSRRTRKVVLYSVVAFVICGLILILTCLLSTSAKKKKEDIYQQATAYYELGNYQEALDAYKSITDYRDSAQKVETISAQLKTLENTYQQAVAYYMSGNYQEAIDIYESIIGYRDSSQKVEIIKTQLEARGKTYQKAKDYLDNDLYEEAIASLTSLKGYDEADQLLEQATIKIYKMADEEWQNENYEKAKSLISLIPESSSMFVKGQALSKKIDETIQEKEREHTYNLAVSYYNNSDYENAQKLLISLDGYLDSKSVLDSIGQHFYEQASKALSSGNYMSCCDYLDLIDTTEEWSQYLQSIELMNNAREKYIELIHKEGKNICRSDGYSAMINYIDSKANKLLSSSDISQLKSDCTIKTARLYDIDPYTTDGYFEKDVNCEDNLSNVYEQVFYAYMWNPYYGEGGKASWYINEEYEYLYATITISKRSGNSSGNGSIYIYGDDKLLYSEKSMKKDFISKDISINISGVKILTIQIDGRDALGLGANFVPYLCNVTLSD